MSKFRLQAGTDVTQDDLGKDGQIKLGDLIRNLTVALELDKDARIVIDFKSGLKDVVVTGFDFSTISTMTANENSVRRWLNFVINPNSTAIKENVVQELFKVVSHYNLQSKLRLLTNDRYIDISGIRVNHRTYPVEGKPDSYTVVMST